MQDPHKPSADPREEYTRRLDARYAAPLQIRWAPGNVGAGHAVPEVPYCPPGF